MTPLTRRLLPFYAALPLLAAAPTLARADTTLTVTAAGSVSAMPDELDASLTASAEAASAGAAQAAVNTLVEAALGAAKNLPAVVASTTAYSVWHETDPKDVWHASQGLALHSTDGAALLNLVGTLQQTGLAVGDLGWRLSPKRAETTYDEAMGKAVTNLTIRAKAVAAQLGLRFVGFERLSVGDGEGPRPMPMFRAMAAAPMAAEAPKVSAQAETTTVSATVSGEARLIGGAS